MRQARRASGLHLDEFLRRVGFSESYVRNVENGTRPVTGDIADAYDRALVTGGMFRGAVEAIHGESWDQPANLSTLTNLSQRSGAVLTAMGVRWAAALAATRPPVPTDGFRHVGSKLLADIDERLDLLRHLDDELGSGEHAAIAHSELAFVVRLLRSGSYTEDLGGQLYSLASEASRQAAWSCFDQGRHKDAEAYFEGALRASASADNAFAGAYALSFFAVHCYSTGQAREAVSMIDTAQTALVGNATPRMAAMLSARSARAQSKAGERTACIRDLGAARVHLDRGPHQDDPELLYWMTEPEIEMIAGSCALELGDPAEALRRFDAAIAADYRSDDQYPRSAAIYLARAAEAHLALHDLDATVTRARHAARCLSSVDSARSSSTLASLREKLAVHRASPVVRDFLESTA
jgi:transcriptional regulator with XRE-family HTH domain